MEAIAWLYWAEKVLIISSIIGLFWCILFDVETGSGRDVAEVAFEEDGIALVLCLNPSIDVGKVFFCGIEHTR